MSETEDKLEIEVTEDPPEVVAVEEKAPEVEKRVAPQDETAEAIAKLKADLDAERSARAAEANARADAEKRAHTAQNEVEDTNLRLVMNAIDTVKQHTDGLKAQYANAMRAQDYDAAAEIQLAMGTATAKLLQLENGKAAMEAEPKRPEPKITPLDPVEALAAQVSPRSAQWIREHPEFARDPQKLRRMIAAHNLAEADGIPLDSDAYFEAIETTLRIQRPEPTTDVHVDAMADTAKVVQRRAAPAAAPVTRSGNGTGQRPGVVRLTKSQMEAAEISGQTPEEYARQLMRIEREGKMH